MSYATMEQAMAAPAPPQEGLKIRGFYRVHIEQDGEIVGDSGWHENQVTNLGFNQYLVSTLGAIAGSKVVTHMALGTGGAPAAGDTTLAGEVQVRAAVTAATSSSSKTLNLTATFASAVSFVTDTRNISNIALCHTSTKDAATIFAGNTFASSAVATNQAVNCTYNIVFS